MPDPAMTPAPTLRIGLISDTHGLLRAEVLEYLAGSDHIIHAGDIGDPAILDALATIAPVTAVRGNNDHGPWAEALPVDVTVALGAIRVHVIHDLAELSPGLDTDPVRVVVSGHSHKPAVREDAGVLFVNPGSAGRRRFRLPIAAGELWVTPGSIRANILEFET